MGLYGTGYKMIKQQYIAKVLFVYLIIVNAASIGTKDICVTPTCVHTASKMLDLMDTTVDPCEDFYQFSCGGFAKHSNAPSEYDSATSELKDVIQQQVKTLIDQPLKAHEPKYVQSVKKFYKSCMNVNAIKDNGLRDIKEVLSKLGGWPVVEGKNWNENDFDWTILTKKLQNIGVRVDVFMRYYVWPSENNPMRRIVHIDETSTYSREIIGKTLSDKVVQKYYERMLDVAVIFGADKASAARELLDALKFEMLLENISHSDEVTFGTHMTIRGLQFRYPSIRWLELINSLLHPYATVTEIDDVAVSSLLYMTKIEKLIRDTPKRVLGNYIIWHVVSYCMKELSYKLKNKKLEFEDEIGTEPTTDARAKKCLSSSINGLHVAVSAMYVKKYLSENTRDNIRELASNINAEMKDGFKKIEWMDKKTKKNALDKLNSMKFRIGYMENWLDDAKLDKYYEDIEMDEDIYLTSILSLIRFHFILPNKVLHVPVNESEDSVSGMAMLAYGTYESTQNSVFLPAGTLQGRFYNYDRPNYMNYGAIGQIIGHEMTHGFDDSGRMYDKNGDLKNWCMPDTENVFKKKSQCVTDFYDNYTVEEIGVKLNSRMALSESIADIGGLKYSYLAYDRWVRKNGEEPGLPGLSYTGRQLFWISAASTHCSKLNLEILEGRANLSVYLPEKYKVWGVVSNQKEFAEDFACEAGAAMNPINKCEVW